MKFAARARNTLLPATALVLAGCAYPPLLPPSSYAFDRHPGVTLEVVWYYNYDGSAYTVSTLVNRSGVDKCAWTAALDSRLLRAGESWQVSLGQTPGNVGVSSVQPADPNCVNAKRDNQ